MTFDKTSSPLTRTQAKEWVQSFEEGELSRHGWSRSRLLECFTHHDYVYNLEAEAPISLIFYQKPADDTLEIIFLATAPTRRKSTSIFALFKELISERPKGKIWLECREDNEAALSLYRKLGLQVSGRRDGYYHDGTAAILFNF